MNNFSELYFTPSLPTSLGGVKRLTSARNSGRKIKASNALDFLRSQDAYTLHKPVRTKFRRRKTIVSGIGEQLQTDLVDVQKYKERNDNVSYLLTAIDVFSKRAWAFPLQSKTGEAVRSALEKILTINQFRTIQSDKGKEFLNKKVQDLFSKFGVRHFTSENENVKASVVERFNRTLQASMHRWMSYTNDERYIDALDQLVTGYNARFHSGIGMAPNQFNEKNQEDVWLRMYSPESPTFKARLKVGDYVRISKARLKFQKGYTGSRSTEIFTVTEVKKTAPIVYEISDFNDDPVVGTFYEQDLKKVEKPETYKVERVIKRKTVRGKRMFFVKWLGYPDSFNQWISQDDLT